MSYTYAMCLCLLVAAQAVFCLPEAHWNPMTAGKYMEKTLSLPSSDEDFLSHDATDSLELVPALLVSRDDLSVGAEALQSPRLRVRRQSAAMDLALSHSDSNGRPRPVGRLHGYADVNVAGNNGRNYHANLGAGVGTVAWRSRNGRHSLGVGATVDQARGRFQGHRYGSRPNVGVGIGYRWRF